jgi:hypothetical protein
VRSHEAAPGKQTLVEQIAAPMVQRRASDPHDPNGEATVHAAASRGVATPASRLPFSDALQRGFGRHDVSSIRAHTGREAAASAQAMGADAYATGDHVVLGRGADLHTVGHEAAHVVQQRGGVQLKGGVGAAGDVYERHADAVADRVVAGQSAEDLLDHGTMAGGHGATPAVQRKEGKDDTKILENQASLKGTDVEIPVLEGALLSTRKEAVKLGLLSQTSFDTGLALSQAMAQLQPAVTAKGAVDPDAQDRAAVAAQQLFTALQRETAGDKNFKIMPSMAPSSAVTSQNPYTEEMRVTTTFLLWSNTNDVGSWLQQLPGLIHQGNGTTRSAATAACSMGWTCGYPISFARRAGARPRKRSVTRSSTMRSSAPASSRSRTSMRRDCPPCSTPIPRRSRRRKRPAGPPPTPSR